ncbi:hypothetical protein LCGC14_3001140, partial [marine sediment metagenome]
MAFTESGITHLRITEYDGGVILHARNTHPDKVDQCYVAGRLVDYQQAVAETVRFRLAGIRQTDT